MTPDAFDYVLPPEQVAQRPSPARTQARLLVLREPVVHTHVHALAEHLPAGALVVVNASRVVPARLVATRDDGRTFELLLSAPAAGQGPGIEITAWVRGAKRLRVGDRLRVHALHLRDLGRDAMDPRARRFAIEAGDVLQTCADAGQVPLPPYIARPDGPTPEDRERYQTVFAAAEGSIAAPTAGLHFDGDLLARLDVVRITLHVGPGTFLPLEAEDVRQHEVGAERYDVEPEAADRIEAARREGRPIVAVGTTVTRTLETLARDGAPIVPGAGTTRLVVVPGFRFQVVTHLLTNFHLPRSSLLMLVCSFAGRERVLSAYREAVAHGYRFHSYGDCMLCTRGPED